MDIFRYGPFEVNRDEFSLAKTFVFAFGTTWQRGWSVSPDSSLGKIAFGR